MKLWRVLKKVFQWRLSRLKTAGLLKRQLNVGIEGTHQKIISKLANASEVTKKDLLDRVVQIANALEPVSSSPKKPVKIVRDYSYTTLNLPQKFDCLLLSNPSWSDIESFLQEGEDSRDVLCKMLRDFSAHESRPDPGWDWAPLHAFRILAYAGDERVIPLVIDTLKASQKWIGGEKPGHTRNYSYDMRSIMRLTACPKLFSVYWSEIRALNQRKYGWGVFEYEMLCAASYCRTRSWRLRFEVMKHFFDDSDFMAHLIINTKDRFYIPFLEYHLDRIAPAIKYVPQDSWDWDDYLLWSSAGPAWFRLREKRTLILTDDEEYRFNIEHLKFCIRHGYCEPQNQPAKEYKLDSAAEARLKKHFEDEKGSLEERFLKRLPETFEIWDAVTGHGDANDKLRKRIKLLLASGDAKGREVRQGCK